jgi:hypothetical protein
VLLIANTVLCHENRSSSSAICVVRLSILLRLIKTRLLSPTVLNFIKIVVFLLKRYIDVIIGLLRKSRNSSPLLVHPQVRPRRSFLSWASLIYFTHSHALFLFHCKLKRCKLGVAKPLDSADRTSRSFWKSINISLR